MSVGTGRNINYYKKGQIKSIVFTDFSQAMLEKAKNKAKFEKAVFKLENSNQLSFRDNMFDTVVQTFGLCSTPNPIQALHVHSVSFSVSLTFRKWKEFADPTAKFYY